MNITQERIFRDYMTGKYTYEDLSVRYSRAVSTVGRLIRGHSRYNREKIKAINNSHQQKKITGRFKAGEKGMADFRKRKEALDRGYLRCMDAGLPWNLAAMDEALKGTI